MFVRNAFSKRDRRQYSLGDGTAPLFCERLTEEGELILEQKGRENIVDIVKASFEASKVYSILDRFQVTGDQSALQQVESFYADVVNVPKTLADAHNAMVNMRNQFDSLPGYVKSSFDNSSDKFAASVMDGTVREKMRSAYKRRLEKVKVKGPSSGPLYQTKRLEKKSNKKEMKSND